MTHSKIGIFVAVGKSSVRSETARAEFWSHVGTDAVVIEADAIKDSDIVLQELQNSGLFDHDASLSQFVHEYSTRRAQGALVAAINQQQDVIFDGVHLRIERQAAVSTDCVTPCSL